jgi:hypothetical protein
MYTIFTLEKHAHPKTLICKIKQVDFFFKGFKQNNPLTILFAMLVGHHQ